MSDSPWHQANSGSDGPHTGWFQGHRVGSMFHLVRASEPWKRWNVKTACDRRINQFDQWDKPGMPGHEYGQIEQYCCPRCVKIMQREDPERAAASADYMQRLYAWMEARGPKPEAP